MSAHHNNSPSTHSVTVNEQSPQTSNSFQAINDLHIFIEKLKRRLPSEDINSICRFLSKMMSACDEIKTCSPRALIVALALAREIFTNQLCRVKERIAAADNPDLIAQFEIIEREASVVIRAGLSAALNESEGWFEIVGER